MREANVAREATLGVLGPEVIILCKNTNEKAVVNSVIYIFS